MTSRLDQLRKRLARLDRQAEYLGKEILFKYVDRKKVFAIQKILQDAEDPQAEELLRDIQIGFIGALTPPKNVEEALNRFSNMVSSSSKDVLNIRNQLGKIADQLRIEMPRGFQF